MAIAFLKPGSNSARTPPPGGGSNAYKADTRKPKGLTRLIRVLLVVSVSEVFRCVSQSHRSQIDVIN